MRIQQSPKRSTSNTPVDFCGCSPHRFDEEASSEPSVVESRKWKCSNSWNFCCVCPLFWEALTFQRRFILQTDASDHGIGAVLSQRDQDGNDHPDAYYSRKLLQQYSIIEKECLAVKLATHAFRIYCWGGHLKSRWIIVPSSGLTGWKKTTHDWLAWV